MTPSKRKEFDGEVKHAMDPRSPYHLVPSFPAGAKVISVGCGGGWPTEVGGAIIFVGIDIDPAAGEYRQEHNFAGAFELGSGECLPIDRYRFNFYYARVSMPYMNIPVALAEANRVLVPGGAIWLSLHDINHLGAHMKRIEGFQPKVWVRRLYTLLNGLCFHFTGKLFKLPGAGIMESFQTKRGIRLALVKAGFTDIEFPPVKPLHFVVTARKV